MLPKTMLLTYVISKKLNSKSTSSSTSRIQVNNVFRCIEETGRYGMILMLLPIVLALAGLYRNLP